MTYRLLPRAVEMSFLVLGLLLLGIGGFRLARPLVFQHRPEWFAPAGPATFARSSKASDGHRHADEVSGTASSADRPSIVGRLEIRRLGLSTFVVEGDDDRALALAPGHIPSSSPLGGKGNAVIAGHRDFAFRALRNVRVGDKIEVRAAGTYIYRVKSMRVVQPNQLSVLDDGDYPTLTLITCYPFRYIGSAPKRFVVKAALMSGDGANGR